MKDVETRVDKLPTHLAVMSLVDSHKVLQSPNVCGTCPGDVSATSFCLQCDVKICSVCEAYHSKFPGLRGHEVVALGALTARRLAGTNRAMCQAHPDKSAELFCSAHKQLICVLCGTTRHEGCSGKKTIDDVTEERRAELTTTAAQVRQKAADINQQVNAHLWSVRLHMNESKFALTHTV